MYNINYMIDKKSKLFFITLFFLIIISIIVTFNKYMINKNFDFFTDEISFNEALSLE